MSEPLPPPEKKNCAICRAEYMEIFPEFKTVFLCGECDELRLNIHDVGSYGTLHIIKKLDRIIELLEGKSEPEGKGGRGV